MTAKAANKTALADHAGSGSGGQPNGEPRDFASRLATALGGRRQAEAARQAGLRPQMLSEYLSRRRGPGAEAVFALADALGVSPRWLLLGDGTRDPEPESEIDPNTIMVPRYELFRFGRAGEKPPAAGEVPLRWEWLSPLVRNIQEAWLAEAPSDALPDVASEGGTIVCRDPEPQLRDGRVYVLLLDGRVIFRRLQVRPEGLLLKAGVAGVEPILIRQNDMDRIVPIARVLATISFKAV